MSTIHRSSSNAFQNTFSTASTPATSDVDSTPEPEDNVRSHYEATIPATSSDQSIPALTDIDKDHPLYEYFKDVLSRFGDPNKEDAPRKEPAKGEVFYDDEMEIPDEEQEEEQLAQTRKSKKKRKAETKLSVAELKSLVKKPELVEWTDTASREPTLLVALRSCHNVVPVPPHWSMKREYLSSKRGIEKSQFALPKFIQETGITEMRDAVLEKQENATLKQKQRERVQPKMGKLDIDYQRLYEAFFRFQDKPELTRFGEVYYEGKEYETNLRHLRPGELSEDLKEALNIPPGAPPPWLINQQRFGPPPSYPALKIPGLNAAPPPGASWGFHPGGYGKPPVDEFNRPLYGGDVFGVAQPEDRPPEEPVDRTLWGELQPPEEESEEEEDEDEDEEEDEEDEEAMAAGMRTQTGTQSTSGITSVAPSEYGGTDSTQDFALRKNKHGTETEESAYPRSAGQVIPEQQKQSSGFFGSDRGYDLRTGMPVLGQEERGTKRKAGDVDVSMDMDSLVREGKLSKEDLQKHYDEGRKVEAAGQWGGLYDDDLSSMIAEEGAKRLKKDQERKTKK